MKHGSFTAIRLILCLILAFVTVLSAYGDEATNQLESIVISKLDGKPLEGDAERGIKSDPDYGYTWKLDASKFRSIETDQDGNVTNEYPKMTYVSAWPVARYGYNPDQEIMSLGIHGRFDRRGYNWIDLYPTTGGDGEDSEAPVEIPIPGRLRNMDMWIWGSNLNFYVEVYLRDYYGVVHNIRLGDIGYTGWKNLRVNLPTSISQQKRQLPAFAGLKFVKFRIWTQPSENVGDFYIYFNQFKVLTDTFESLFDGNNLANPDYVQELWANTDSQN